jgi:hypothetical protein
MAFVIAPKSPSVNDHVAAPTAMNLYLIGDVLRAARTIRPGGAQV